MKYFLAILIIAITFYSCTKKWTPESDQVWLGQWVLDSIKVYDNKYCMEPAIGKRQINTGYSNFLENGQLYTFINETSNGTVNSRYDTFKYKINDGLNLLLVQKIINGVTSSETDSSEINIRYKNLEITNFYKDQSGFYEKQYFHL